MFKSCSDLDSIANIIRDLYDHLPSTRHFTLRMDKIFTRALRFIREVAMPSM